MVALLRHAKSDWGNEGLADHERPLNGRGRRSAEQVAATLVGQAIKPDLVLVSSAQRTRETVAAFEHALPQGVGIRYEDELYGASAGSLLDRLQLLPNDVHSVLVVGHNPGIEELVRALARPVVAERLADGMRTATLVVLDVPAGTWAEVAPETADLVGRWEHPGGKKHG